MESSVASLVQNFSPKSPATNPLPCEPSTVPKIHKTHEIHETHETHETYEVEQAESVTPLDEMCYSNSSYGDVSIDDADDVITLTPAKICRNEFLARFHAYIEGMTLPDDPAGPGGINHPSRSLCDWEEVKLVEELKDGQEIPDGLTGDAAKREWLSMLWRDHENQPHLESRWSDTTEETSEEGNGEENEGDNEKGEGEEGEEEENEDEEEATFSSSGSEATGKKC